MSNAIRSLIRRAPTQPALVLLAVEALVAPTSAQWILEDARTEIGSLGGGPTAQHVITRPGSYVLRQNLVGVSGKSGILVMADHVTIDLNGYRLEGGSGTVHGITDGGTGVVNVAVMNGSLVDWGQDALALSNSQFGLIDDLVITESNQGMNLGSDFLVHDYSVRLCLTDGIRAGQGSSFLDGSCKGNVGHGIQILNVPSGQSGTLIADSSFVENGVSLTNGSLIVRCDFEHNDTNPTPGQALCQGSRMLVIDSGFRAETFSYDSYGISSNNSCLAFGNEFHGFLTGILTGNRSWIRDNRFVACQTSIQSIGGSLITGNTSISSANHYQFTGTDSYGEVLNVGGSFLNDSNPWANLKF